MIEQVFVLEEQDLNELYRIRSFIDGDGIFFATLDRYDSETKTWEESYLTQFQQDEKTVIPILKDENQEILQWFGFDLNDVATQEQLDRIANDSGR